MTATKTAGQQLADELRRYYNIGPRTRWNRRNAIGIHLTRADILNGINNAVTMPGSYSQHHTTLVQPGRPAVLAWWKLTDDYRINPVLCTTLLAMKPWDFTAYLGRMVDTGHTNNGQFEIWFGTERDRLAQAGA